jgi:hypothetical protein
MRVTISLQEAELRPLAAWARSECRDVRAQIRFIVIEELRRRALLSTDETEPSYGGATAKETANAATR